MGKKLHNNGPKKGAKTKPMSSQLLWRHSRFNDDLDSVQPWEVWRTYEDARRALKALSPGRAREQAKRKAKAALILGLWEIERIEENGRLKEQCKKSQIDEDVGNKKSAKPARRGKREEGPDLEGFE
jgi:hypothetical protein